MDYWIFKEYLKKRLRDYLPDTYKDYEIKIMTVTESYNERDVVKIVPPEYLVGKMEAGVYLDYIYEEFLIHFNLKKSFQKAVALLEEALQYNEQISKENVFFTLVDTDANHELLDRYPTRFFHGLTIMYRLFIEKGHPEFYSCFVTNQMASCLETDETELFSMALVNTRTLFPPIVETIGEVFFGMIKKSSIDAKIKDNLSEELKLDDDMYVLRNERGFNGAIYMIYEDILENIADHIGNDYYILPSSIYDMYIVPIKEDKLVDMDQLKAESRGEGLEPAEKLTSQIYYYNAKEKKICLFEMK